MIKLPTSSPKTLILGVAALFCPLFSSGDTPLTLLHLRNNWYLAAAGDIAWHNDLRFEPRVNEFSDVTYDVGQGTSVSIGKACGFWRLEFEAAYRKSNSDELFTHLGDEKLTGFIRDFALMLNAYWDMYILPNSFWVFYLGGGFGISFQERQDCSANTNVDIASNTLFAWQGMTGFGYEIIEHVFLNAGYRLFMTAKPRSSTEHANHIVWIHNIELGVRIEL